MFSKKPDDAPRPSRVPSAKPVAGNSTFSVIGSDVTITGNIAASVDLHVDGQINGDIECSNLVQGEGSVVEGKVQAESARLAGRVKGSINSRDLVILKSAVIEGDVHYDSLTIEQGASVEGHFGARKAAATTPASPKPKAEASSSGKADGDEPQLSIAG